MGGKENRKELKANILYQIKQSSTSPASNSKAIKVQKILNILDLFQISRLKIAIENFKLNLS